MCNLSPTSTLTLFNLISLDFILTISFCEILTNKSKLHLLFSLLVHHFVMHHPWNKGDRSSISSTMQGTNFFKADVVDDAIRESFFFLFKVGSNLSL